MMLYILKTLPDVLLQSLGLANRQNYLIRAFDSQISYKRNLLHHHEGTIYPVRFPPLGLDLTLQCVNPEAEESELHWGLHSFTLHTPESEPVHHWTRAWLQGLDPLCASVRDVVDLLARHCDPVLQNPSLICFTVPGLDQQHWSLLFRFNPDSGKLLTLSVVKTDEWISASVLPPWPKAH